MHVSSVQIANFALSKIGGNSTIESLTEDSTEAKVAKLWFDFAREEALAAFNWSFARKRLALAVHDDDPPEEWIYRYVYPADCVKARYIENPLGINADPIPFDVETGVDGGKSILTDVDEAKLVYTYLATNPSQYPPYFVDLFATILASHMALSLAGRRDLVEYLEGAAAKKLVFASAMDANEKQERAARDAEWIRSR